MTHFSECTLNILRISFVCYFVTVSVVLLYVSSVSKYITCNGFIIFITYLICNHTHDYSEPID